MNNYILITAKINNAISNLTGTSKPILQHNIASHVLNTYVIEVRNYDDRDVLYFKFKYDDIQMCVKLPVKLRGKDYVFKYGNDDKKITTTFKDIIIKLAEIQKIKNELKAY